jgi:putative CocE/NonD family hydrolase
VNRHLRLATAALCTASVALLVGGTELAAVPASAVTGTSGPGYTTTTLHFDVTVGPVGSPRYHCDIVGDLYRPSSATSSKPVPAVLTTNGFGGSKDDQATLAGSLASRGYGVLSYSGLGFGGSGCNIELDDPDWDGQAASQLVSFLGGGSAAKDGTRVNWIRRDATAADGKHHANDPRVGMIGGSYGGQVQFAAAGIDPRIDTIIPIITWNDLSYSLAPNNTSTQRGVTYATPGVLKKEWTSFFFGEGVADSAYSPPVASDPPTTCPNFETRACPAIAQMQALGYPDSATLQLARHASVESYVGRIHIPTLLAQGQADTLFNLRESTATYAALKEQGTPVKLLWQSWGHSNSTPAPGEYDQANPEQSYEGQTFLAWFDHYLKGTGPAPALNFSYFRDWVGYSGNAAPAYASSASYPAGATQRLFLGTGLTRTRPSTTTSQSFVAATTPTNYSETSAIDSELGAASPPPTDAPGSYASWASSPLTTDVDVVGIPTMTVTVQDPVATAPGVALFAKLYDVAPDGSVTLVHKLISPIRVSPAQLGHPITVALPGIVHRFGTGHTLKLVLAGTDAAYSTNLVAQPVTVTSSATCPGTLTLPVVHGHL